MNKFQNRFFQHIMEQDNERAAMEASLDKNTNPSDFDLDNEPTDNDYADLTRQASQIKTKQAQQMQNQLNSWVAKCDEFLIFLNGTNSDSIQTILSRSEPDTIFERMKQSEQRKIARVATELAALTESFKGYLAQSNNSQFKYV